MEVTVASKMRCPLCQMLVAVHHLANHQGSKRCLAQQSAQRKAARTIHVKGPGCDDEAYLRSVALRGPLLMPTTQSTMRL